MPYQQDGDHRQLVSIFLGSPNLRGRSGRMLMAWESAVSHGLERRGPTTTGIDPALVGAVLGAALKWGTRRCMLDPTIDLHAAVLDALDHLDERTPSLRPTETKSKTTSKTRVRAKTPTTRAKTAASAATPRPRSRATAAPKGSKP
jgi:hypothetical protein